MPARYCQRPGCRKTIPADRRSDAKYHSPECQKAAAKERSRARKKMREGTTTESPTSTYTTPGSAAKRARDAIIASLQNQGMWDAFLAGRVTQAELARILDVKESMVKRAIDELRLTTARTIASDGWQMADDIVHLLALDLPMPDRQNTAQCLQWASDATERFMAFEAHMFISPAGVAWLREDFHKVWIFEILLAYATGGYLQILSPPRHGKSELLTHFVVWLICRNPNIRILWVGPSDEIVAERITKMEELLEDYDLVSQVLPPDQTFAPAKRGPGAVWTQSKFKVTCRAPGIAGNTVTGMGRGAKLLSRNADIIIGDDIEDHQSTELPAARKKTRRWFGTQLDSRKEEHTALILIGSRQHALDLYGFNLESDQWRHIVNSAHDPNCELDEYDVDLHVDCMLFPELRSYRWLLSKKIGADSLDEDGDEGTYEMVYQNDPSASGAGIYTKALVVPSFNKYRTIGLDGIPARGRRLIAGLDPGATRFQVGFLWATTPVSERTLEVEIEGMGILTTQEWRLKRWMVDVDERIGGGTDKAVQLMELWRVMYGVRHWIIEDNALQQGFLTDNLVVTWKRLHDITIEGSNTQGKNKYDPSYGVGAMSRLWRRDLIDLPYGDEESRAKTQSYAKQLYKFVDDVKAERRRKKDIHMASWFPQKRIRAWEREEQEEKSSVEAVASDYPASYTGIDSFTGGIGRAPWNS